MDKQENNKQKNLVNKDKEKNNCMDTSSDKLRNVLMS